MLAVGVELDGDLVALGPGVPEPGAQRGADPEVERVAQHGGPRGHGPLGGGVTRPVVDDQDVGVEVVAHRGDDVGDGLLLVERRDDHQHDGRPYQHLASAGRSPLVGGG